MGGEIANGARAHRADVTPRVLVAADKFKGTFSARRVARLLHVGLAAGGWSTDLLPVADGDEGTGDALLAAQGGHWFDAEAHEALGRRVRAPVAMLGDGATGVVEVAAASGLWRIAEGERDAPRVHARHRRTDPRCDRARSAHGDRRRPRLRDG